MLLIMKEIMETGKKSVPFLRPQVKIGRAVAALAALSFLPLPSDGHTGEEKPPASPVFTVAWSTGAGNTPYPYLERSGTLKKWADRYHVEIKLERRDYGLAIDAFAAKKLDACVMSNMEALGVAAASGTETTAVYVNDSSKGNDVILARNGVELKDLSSKRILLTQKSVSLYLLERAMAMEGMESEIPRLKLIDAAADGIAPKFLKDPAIDVVVSWKPMAGRMMAEAKAKDLFNSSRIPGEIVHFMAARTEVIKRPDGSGERFAKALTGAWYEVMEQMGWTVTEREVLGGIASASENTLESLTEQLNTTRFFRSPTSALNFENGSGTKENMRAMRLFCFNHKLLGDTKSPEDVAIEYPDKSIQGEAGHVRLHLVSTYMALAVARML